MLQSHVIEVDGAFVGVAVLLAATCGAPIPAALHATTGHRGR
jgi:hypothetical protein